MSSPLNYYHKKVSFDNYSPDVIQDSDSLPLAEKPVSPPLSDVKSILKNRQDSTGSANDTSLGSTPRTLRNGKKSLVEMTDEEILQLDSQFATKTVNVGDFKFETDYSLSANSLASAKLARKTSLACTNSLDYPTKPIVKNNSLCLGYKHHDFTQTLNNNKFYVILISSKISSLSAIDYYLHKLSKDGDNVIVCCSFSDETAIDSCLKELVDLVLTKFLRHDPSLKAQINFEVFRTTNYLSDVLNLYTPNLILVGTSFRRRRSSSILSRRSFIPIIYVNAGYSANDHNARQQPETPQIQAELVDSPGGVVFHQPFPNTASKPIPIKSSLTSSSAIVSSSSSSLSSNESIDSFGSVSRFKTNETTCSLLFEKLNDLPLIEDQGNTIASEMAASKPTIKVRSLLGDEEKPATNSGSMSTSPFSKPNILMSPKADSLSTIDPATGMAVPQMPVTKQSSIVDQYNRRMSAQTSGVSGKVFKKTSLPDPQISKKQVEQKDHLSPPQSTPSQTAFSFFKKFMKH